jgi:hypothetical protein
MLYPADASPPAQAGVAAAGQGGQGHRFNYRFRQPREGRTS